MHPLIRGLSRRSRLLASCYRESLRVAAELGARTVAFSAFSAFSAVSTGIYGWPLDDGAAVALRTVREEGGGFEEVRFVLFDQATYDVFEAELDQE